MQKICVIQHTEAQYLGLIEDHLEGRNVRFIYKRPFASGGSIPGEIEDFDGLWLLGGGPYGLVSGHLLPSFMPELRLTKMFLDAGLPVVGFELGALILTAAAGGGVEEAPLRFDVVEAKATELGQTALDLPAAFPMATYLRDRPKLPGDAEVFATSPEGDPLVFGLNGNCVGMIGHPGTKPGMTEDLIMEFVETPDDTAASLEKLWQARGEIAESLSQMMVGLVRRTNLMPE